MSKGLLRRCGVLFFMAAVGFFSTGWPAFAKGKLLPNAMNIYFAAGGEYALPSVDGVNTTPKPGWIIGVMPDFCSGNICPGIDLFLINRRFESPVGIVNAHHVHVAAVMRFYVTPFLAFGAGPYYGILLDKNVLLESTSEAIQPNELGGLFSVRINMNVIPGPMIGLAFEFRLLKSLAGSGDGSKIRYLDPQALFALRLGMF